MQNYLDMPVGSSFRMKNFRVAKTRSLTLKIFKENQISGKAFSNTNQFEYSDFSREGGNKSLGCI